MNTMVGRLAEKMDKDASNGGGWLLLARAYREVGRHREAALAYAKAAALLPPDAGLLADWADSQVLANDRQWDDEARGIVRRALAADPKHLKSLALAGADAFERANYAEAIAFWKRMQAAAPADSMDWKLAESSIREATARMSGGKGVGSRSGPTAATPSIAARGSASPAGAITGVVALDADLKWVVAPTDTVFVIAKPVDGRGAPLAVRRFRAGELPARFSLDDGAAMTPEHTVARAGEALVLARLSKSGDAIAQTGDLQTAALRVKAGTGDVRLQILAK